MKYILILILIASTTARANDLCPVNESRPADIRIPESYFTEENAQNALKELDSIVSGASKSYEWITVPNLQRIIEGYVLRRDALEGIKFNVPSKLDAFCIFMEHSAWWFD